MFYVDSEVDMKCLVPPRTPRATLSQSPTETPSQSPAETLSISSFEYDAGIFDTSASGKDNMQFNSFLCQTKKISNTHFRGSGSQNGGIIIESIFKYISHFLNNQKNRNLNDIKSTLIKEYIYLKLESIYTKIKILFRFKIIIYYE